MKTHVAVFVALALALSPLAAVAADKPVTDVKELAGTWQGWTTLGTADERATMTVKADGSYEAATRVGTKTVGQFYLENGKLRYRSSRSTGSARLSEDKGKTFLTVVPEGTTYETGTTEYARVK
jgi:hypothetical protein